MSSNRRIIKNTVMLYIRMIVSMCINLYASRLVLEILGVEDFGVYNIVGGIVAVMSFLNSSMAGSTSRFLTYELGRGNKENLSKTFSSALFAHIYIAIFVLVVGETVGLWFINTQIVVPDSRIVAVKYVYQFSLYAAIMTFIKIPYQAEVISHEKMDIYAFIEIFYVVLKLLAIYLISFVDQDKLIVYAFLIFAVSLIVLLTYVVYAKRAFEETRRLVKIDKNTLLPMLKFSGWDVYGNSCVIMQQQGINILINRFFGVALNAASAVATQAGSVVSMFLSNITMALRPPIIKKYSVGDIAGMQNLLQKAIIICSLLAAIICVPLYLRVDTLMAIWLVDVPEYSVMFTKWLILANVIIVINTLFNTIIHATGNIKRLSIISGTIYLSTLFFTYLGFRYINNPVLAYAISFMIAITVLISNVFIAKKQIPQLSLLSICKGLSALLFSILISVIICVLVNHQLTDGFWGFVLLFAINLVVLAITAYLLLVVPKHGWNLIKFIRNEI